MTISARKSSGFRIGNLEISPKNLKQNVLPPALAIFGFLAVWELLSASGITLLPGPSSLFTDPRTFELVRYPFYDKGGIDKGMFWQTWASLQRVAISYTLAAIVGISMGIAIGSSQALSKALDPLFLFLRTVPPLAWRARSATCAPRARRCWHRLPSSRW